MQSLRILTHFPLIFCGFQFHDFLLHQRICQLIVTTKSLNLQSIVSNLKFHTRLLCANSHGVDASKPRQKSSDPPKTESPFDGPKALQARWIRQAISPRFLGDSEKWNFTSALRDMFKYEDVNRRISENDVIQQENNYTTICSDISWIQVRRSSVCPCMVRSMILLWLSAFFCWHGALS